MPIRPPNGSRIHLPWLALALLSSVSTPAAAQALDFVSNGQALENTASQDVALADLDGDGDLDAFVATGNFGETGGDIVWINQGGFQDGGEGQFASHDQRLGTADSRAVAVGDINGAGLPDVVVGSLLSGGGEDIRVYFRESSFAFPTPQRPGSGSVEDLALGDIDGDGDLDLVTATSASGEPNDAFAYTPFNFFGPASGPPLGSGQASSVALGDLDGDGDLDAFLGIKLGTDRGNQVWLNQGFDQGGAEGVFSDSGQRLGNRLTTDVELADLDDDGDLDAVATNGGTETHAIAWMNQGGVQGGTPGVFQAGHVWSNLHATDAALGDLDADGDIDAVFARANQLSGNDNRVWLNDGSGGFTDTGLSLGSSTSTAVALGDLDGDGDLDLFVTNAGTVGAREPDRVYLNQASAPPPPPADSDLSISLLPPGDTALKADLLLSNASQLWTIQVQNAGPDTASGAEVTLTTSADNWFGVSSGEPGAGCASFQPGVMKCALPDLASGESISFSAGATEPYRTTSSRPFLAASLDLHTRVVAGGFDPDSTDDRAQARADFYDCASPNRCLAEQVFCRQSFPDDTGGTAVTRGSVYVPDIGMYFRLRQRMNASAPGVGLVDRYRNHNGEIMALMLSDTALMNQALVTMELWEPNLRDLVEGRGDNAVITSEQVEALDALLLQLTSSGSAGLQSAIAQERTNIGPLTDLVGQTMRQAADQIIPSDVIGQDRFLRLESVAH